MKQIKDTFFIVVGNMICSLGIGTIALRLGLSLGGVSGLAKVLHNVLPVSISILVLAVNLVLFALAYFFVGKKFAMNSFLSVILFPVFLEFAQSITVLDCLKEDLLLGTLIGGILLGSGSGLILTNPDKKSPTSKTRKWLDELSLLPCYNTSVVI